MSPFCDIYGGCVLNATINKYAYANIEERDDGRLVFNAADQKIMASYELAPTIDLDQRLDLHKGVYNRIVNDFNQGRPLPITLTTFSEAPAGSGLGSSSTLVVAMIKAFVEYLNLPLGEYDIASLAYRIEREDINLNGGKQDQYAATFGGFNYIEFCSGGGIVVNPLRIKNWIISELEASLILYYTGVSRESAGIIEKQANNVRKGDNKSIEAMKNLKESTIYMKECVLKGDFIGFADSLEASWKSKKQMADNISNANIDTIYESAKAAGAKAGKVSGAGGGGFMMFFVEPARRMEVVAALKGYGGDIVSCNFTKHGTQGWRVG